MIGNYKVPVKLYEGISIDLGLKVVSDGTNLEEEVFEITDTESKTVTENKEVDENDEKSNQITSTEEESLKETDVKNNTADVPEKNTEKEEKKD